MTNQNDDWREFFARTAATYDQEVFTKGTVAEVDFLIEALHLVPGRHLLDIGCGTGRHAVELARRGIEVTGLDLSPEMLAKARQRAREAGVSVEFVEADAGDWKPQRQYDAAMSVCEGAFCLLGRHDSPFRRDMAILFSMAAALGPGCPILLTVLNGYRFIREATQDKVNSGIINLFDMTGRCLPGTPGADIPAGLQLRERFYTAPELVRMIVHSGFKVDQLWGGTAGNWRREPPDLDEMELMIVAHRTE